MIYVNGDSYSVISDGKNYSNVLGERFNEHVMNKAIPGSCNGRIFRVTCRDLLKLHKQNVENVKVCVGLSFWYRTELWIDEHGIDRWYQFQFDDGEFASFQATTNTDWWQHGPVVSSDVPKFFKKPLQEWVKTINADAAIVNTLHQASLLLHLCKSLGYKLVIFWAADVTEELDRIDTKLDALKDFYAEFDQTNSFDLLNYSFVRKFNKIRHPIDYEKYGLHGHPGTLSHTALAEEIYEKLLIHSQN